MQEIFSEDDEDADAKSSCSLLSTATPCQDRQVYSNIQIGMYKNQYVRIKEVCFDKDKGIPADVMKELKTLRELNHKNINPFIGASMKSKENILILTEFCSRGSLQDILANREIRLDHLWVASFISDLGKGMRFLHYSTQIEVHGNLRSSNCVVTSR